VFAVPKGGVSPAYSCVPVLGLLWYCRWAGRVGSGLSPPWDMLLAALALDSPGWPEHSRVTTGSCRSEKVPRG